METETVLKGRFVFKGPKQSPTPSSSASVKNEPTEGLGANDRKAWQWVEKRGWTPVSHSSRASSATINGSTKKRSSAASSDIEGSGAGRKRMKLECDI